MTGGERFGMVLDEDIVDGVRSVLADHPVSFAMVFGSAARDGAEGKSDIDLAVEFGDIRPTDDGYSDIYLRLCSELDDELTREVDVVDVHSLTPRFARAVFDTGVVIVGDEGTKTMLERDLATGSLSVKEARNRIAAAAEKLKEGT